jgi:plasmid maintenance system antidote protein VapI
LVLCGALWLNAQLACDLYEQMHSAAAEQIRRIRRIEAPDRASA